MHWIFSVKLGIGSSAWVCGVGCWSSTCASATRPSVLSIPIKHGFRGSGEARAFGVLNLKPPTFETKDINKESR